MTILSTPKAAEYLRCSSQFLKRKRDSRGGFLKEGKHYSGRELKKFVLLLESVGLVFWR